MEKSHWGSRTNTGEKFMGHCPCCEDQLLRRIRSGELHWFCRSCWQEMPLVSLSCKFEIAKPAASNAANALVSAKHLGHRSSYAART